jgi:hypothetical protein
MYAGPAEGSSAPNSLIGLLDQTMSSSVLNSSGLRLPATGILSTSMLNLLEIKNEELVGVDTLKEENGADCKRLASAASVSSNNMVRLPSTTSMDPAASMDRLASSISMDRLGSTLGVDRLASVMSMDSRGAVNAWMESS